MDLDSHPIETAVDPQFGSNADKHPLHDDLSHLFQGHPHSQDLSKILQLCPSQILLALVFLCTCVLCEVGADEDVHRDMLLHHGDD